MERHPSDGVINARAIRRLTEKASRSAHPANGQKPRDKRSIHGSSGFFFFFDGVSHTRHAGCIGNVDAKRSQPIGCLARGRFLPLSASLMQVQTQARSNDWRTGTRNKRRRSRTVHGTRPVSRLSPSCLLTGGQVCVGAAAVNCCVHMEDLDGFVCATRQLASLRHSSLWNSAQRKQTPSVIPKSLSLLTGRAREARRCGRPSRCSCRTPANEPELVAVAAVSCKLLVAAFPDSSCRVRASGVLECRGASTNTTSHAMVALELDYSKENSGGGGGVPGSPDPADCHTLHPHCWSKVGIKGAVGVQTHFDMLVYATTTSFDQTASVRVCETFCFEWLSYSIAFAKPTTHAAVRNWRSTSRRGSRRQNRQIAQNGDHFAKCV